MAATPLLPLAYSTNLHAAETIDEIAAAMSRCAGPLRQVLGWDRIGVDLRLGSAALAAGPAGWERLRRALDAAGASAHTINGFPLRPFQAPRVKEQAYLPDWTEPGRLADSVRLIDAALALSDAPTITVSTIPGTYRPVRRSDDDARAAASAIGRWAAVAAQTARDRGRTVVLCLEPEPWCLLENTADVVWFWRGPLAEAGLAAAAADLGGDVAAARAALAAHVAICLDTCHVSLAFEDQAGAVTQMAAAGARIAKVQASAAVRVDPRDAAALRRVHAMAEPRFNHQTTAARRLGEGWGSRCTVEDLHHLDELLRRLPDADEIRSHFHVPLTGDASTTTVDGTRAGVAAALAAGCQHLAVETYTWPLLATDEAAVMAGTADELRWLAGVIG